MKGVWDAVKLSLLNRVNNNHKIGEGCSGCSKVYIELFAGVR